MEQCIFFAVIQCKTSVVEQEQMSSADSQLMRMRRKKRAM